MHKHSHPNLHLVQFGFQQDHDGAANLFVQLNPFGSDARSRALKSGRENVDASLPNDDRDENMQSGNNSDEDEESEEEADASDDPDAEQEEADKQDEEDEEYTDNDDDDYNEGTKRLRSKGNSAGRRGRGSRFSRRGGLKAPRKMTPLKTNGISLRRQSSIGELDPKKRYCKYRQYGCSHKGFLKAIGKCIERHEACCPKRLLEPVRLIRALRDTEAKPVQQAPENTYSGASEEAQIVPQSNSAGPCRNTRSRSKFLEVNDTRLSAEKDTPQKHPIQTYIGIGSEQKMTDDSGQGRDTATLERDQVTFKHENSPITDKFLERNISSQHLDRLCENIDVILNTVEKSNSNLLLQKEDSQMKNNVFNTVANQYLQVLQIGPGQLSQQKAQIYAFMTNRFEQTFKKSTNLVKQIALQRSSQTIPVS